MTIWYDEAKRSFEVWDCDKSLEGEAFIASVRLVASCPTAAAADAAHRLIYGTTEHHACPPDIAQHASEAERTS